MFFSRIGLISLFLSFFCCSLLTAKPLKVVAINQDFASIAESIGQDKLEVYALVKGSRNLHAITAKPSMVMKVKSTDLLIRLGMKQDSWLDGVIHVAKNQSVFKGQTGYLDCSTDIDKLEVPTQKIDGSHGDIHKYGNPHYWLSPQNGAVIAKQICDRLTLLDPENKAFYESNYRAFIEQLDAKILVWKKQMKQMNGYSFVTYHKVWSYFFDFFNCDSLGELEPLPGVPPSTLHLKSLKEKAVASDKKTMVLVADYYPKKSAASFSQMVKGRYVSLPTNVGDQGIDSFFDLFDVLIQKMM